MMCLLYVYVSVCCVVCFLFFFKQKTAYEMRISDWSSDVCSSDLHVTEPRAFVSGLAARLAEGGLLILSTPNRTFRARLMMITLGEGTGRIPKGTHDWDKFLTPDELCAILEEAGLEVLDVTGMAWSPTRGLSLSDDKSLEIGREWCRERVGQYVAVSVGAGSLKTKNKKEKT